MSRVQCNRKKRKNFLIFNVSKDQFSHRIIDVEFTYYTTLFNAMFIQKNCSFIARKLFRAVLSVPKCVVYSLQVAALSLRDVSQTFR